MELSLGPDSVLLPAPTYVFFPLSCLLAFSPASTYWKQNQRMNGREGGRKGDKEKALSGGEFR